MKTAIVDTKKTGHHLEYVYAICSNLSKEHLHNEIDVYCNDCFNNYIRENELPILEENEQFKIKKGKLEAPQGNWLQIIKTAYQNIKELSNYDRIVFLNLNPYLPALSTNALLNKISFSFSGILFNPPVKGKDDRKSWIRNFAFKFILSKYKDCRIFVLNDDEAAEILNRKYSTDAFEVLVDPVPEFYYKGLADNHQKSDEEKFQFIMIGSISKRKGIFEFLDAIQKSQSKARFLIAGNIDNAILAKVEQKVAYLQAQGINLEIHNRYLSNKEFTKFIKASDIIVMPYHSKGASSGILGHAAFSNTAVIGPNIGLIADIINDYEMGVTINPNNLDQFIKYLDNPDKVISACNLDKMEQYVNENSIEEFYTKIMYS
jgi:glycosyltransferase involved in cell wall biosynthesis